MASRSPLPTGLGVELDRAVRLADEGHLLVGGDPTRAVRLTSRQVSGLIRWISGAPVRDAEEGATAADLIAAGLAHPSPSATLNGRLRGGPSHPSSRPVGERGGPTVDIVVIDRGAAGGLTATLDRLTRLHPGAEPIVVGATGPAARAARERGARVLPIPVGGAAARALALTVSDAELVALVDAGHLPRPGWLEACTGHFADPAVAAVLPRTLVDLPASGGEGSAAVAAVAAARVGPDRGPDPAPVLPWGHAAPGLARPAGADTGDPLGPVTALVLRRSAVDPSLLDPALGAAAEPALLWSLADRGLTVRHEPRSRVRVPPLADLGGYLRACAGTGAAAARLARLRGTRAAGPELSPTGVAVLAALLAGRPLSAAALAVAGGGVRVAALAAAGVPADRTAPAVAAGLVRQTRAASRALRGAWWPPAAAALTLGAVRITRDLRCGRRPAAATVLATAATAAALVAPHPAAWRTARGAAPVDPLTWTALGIAGDAARGLGTWWGMARSRSAAPLLPRVRRPDFAVAQAARARDPARAEEGSRTLVRSG
ncbi:family 2 glycosyl transferase [Nocardiopsis sp. NPDC006139]|uniref:family 2 glycosyl transferase n=1 Tax=Nocardiopsis sp. NPDC006139 TaxID=3154578 RepID=UPI0033A8FFD8